MSLKSLPSILTPLRLEAFVEDARNYCNLMAIMNEAIRLCLSEATTANSSLYVMRWNYFHYFLFNKENAPLNAFVSPKLGLQTSKQSSTRLTLIRICTNVIKTIPPYGRPTPLQATCERWLAQTYTLNKRKYTRTRQAAHARRALNYKQAAEALISLQTEGNKPEESPQKRRRVGETTKSTSVHLPVDVKANKPSKKAKAVVTNRKNRNPHVINTNVFHQVAESSSDQEEVTYLGTLRASGRNTTSARAPRRVSFNSHDCQKRCFWARVHSLG